MQGPNPYAAPTAPQYPPHMNGFAPAPMSYVGYRQGKSIVVPSGAPLPMICVKCGVNHGLIPKVQPFQFIPVHGRFFGVIGMMLTRRTGTLTLPICPTCDARWKQSGWALAGAIVGGLVLWGLLTGVCAAISEDAAGIGAVLGFFLFLGALIAVGVAVVKPRQIQVVNIEKDGRMTLNGFHEAAASAITGS